MPTSRRIRNGSGRCLPREIELDEIDTKPHKDRYGKTLENVGPAPKVKATAAE